ncbi:rhodanese-like domain-containing protein [Microbacterium tumbae]
MAELTMEDAAALAPLLTAEEAIERARSGDVLVIDVRGEEGRMRDGELPGAVPVDRTTVEEEFSPAAAVRSGLVSSVDTSIIVVCGSVRGSGPVAAQLIELGYTDVTHVDGGFAAWQEASGGAVPVDGPACAV